MVFNYELIRYRDHMDQLPFVAELEKRGLKGQQLADYEKLLRGFAERENFYWKRPASPPSGPSTAH